MIKKLYQCFIKDKRVFMRWLRFGRNMFVLGIIVMELTILRGIAAGQNVILPPSMPSSESIIQWKAYCYDVWSLTLLNCQFTYNSTKGPYDGGHSHDSGRPIGGFRYKEGDEPRTIFSFSSMNSVVSFQYLSPEVSGDVNLNMSATIPYPYICIANCSWKVTLNVGVQGLEQMPESGNGYWRLTGSYGEPGVTSLHTYNHYGTSSTKGALELIAWRYFDDTGGDILGINDMSLPKGGMFDLNNQWWVANTPGNGHVSHRTGTDADIDRGEFNCDVDGLLWEAIEFANKYGYVSGGQPNADLLCESGGRKHIDFD